VSPEPGRWDRGLQPERTVLAWRRSALSLFVGSLVGARVLAAPLGQVAVVLGVLGCLLAAGTWVAASRRGSTVTTELLRRGDLRDGPGAGLIAVLTAASVLAGVVGFVVVLVGR
jgi:putative membrane protein